MPARRATWHWRDPRWCQDGRTDLFSLAVVLFGLLTGEKPFPGIRSPPCSTASCTRPELKAPAHRAVPGPQAFLRRAGQDPADRFPDGNPSRGRCCGPPSAPPAPPRLLSAPSPPRLRAGRPALLRGDWGRRPAGGACGGASACALLRRQGVPARRRGARVRTEPAGLQSRSTAARCRAGRQRAAGAALRTLTLTQACRTVRCPLSPDDAGREIVLARSRRGSFSVAPGPGAVISERGSASDAPATPTSTSVRPTPWR